MNGEKNKSLSSAPECLKSTVPTLSGFPSTAEILGTSLLAVLVIYFFGWTCELHDFLSLNPCWKSWVGEGLSELIKSLNCNCSWHSTFKQRTHHLSLGYAHRKNVPDQKCKWWKQKNELGYSQSKTGNFGHKTIFIHIFILGLTHSRNCLDLAPN